MIEERVSVLERMTAALAGSGDVACAGAIGAAQTAPGRLSPAHAKQLHGVVENGVGGMALVTTVGRGLTALQAQTNQTTYDHAKAALVALVTGLNKARRWALSERNVERVAEGSLLMHIHPSCPECRGRGRALLPGTSYVDMSQCCTACGGTGQRPYPKRFQEQIAATLNIVGLLQSLAEQAVTKELRA